MAFRPPGAGDLRHRIALRARTQTANPAGGFDDVYTTVATPWAAARTLFGGRLIDGVQDQERITHNFTIRWRGDRAAWRYVEFDSRRFTVRTVSDPTERREWLEILAEEIAAL